MGRPHRDQRKKKKKEKSSCATITEHKSESSWFLFFESSQHLNMGVHGQYVQFLKILKQNSLETKVPWNTSHQLNLREKNVTPTSYVKPNTIIWGLSTLDNHIVCQLVVTRRTNTWLIMIRNFFSPLMLFLFINLISGFHWTITSLMEVRNFSIPTVRPSFDQKRN